MMVGANSRKKIGKSFRNALGRIYPKALCSYLYYRTFGKKLDWKNPKSFNEWVCWLEYNTDTSLWSILADKYRMRGWVTENGFGEHLPELHGVYYRAEQIDFDKLPEKFVLKPNNGCGQVILVKDKSKIDRKEIIKTAEKWLKTIFGYETAEPHYVKIPKCIVAEELLENPDGTSLIDYKWYCFNGEPKLVQVLSNRDYSSSHKFNYQIYDTEWNPHDEFMREKNLKADVKKPMCLEQQLEICRKLSKGFPQIRIDLYEVNNKVYIGELTLTNAAGKDTDYTEDALLLLGSYIDKNLTKRR